MLNRPFINKLLLIHAVLYAVALLVATRLVPDLGLWYSITPVHGEQARAMLSGQMALSNDIGDLKFDHTWSEGGVHQVWGLGVPIWRLPFEIAARLCGYEMFADRIAFGLFALLAAFVVFRVSVDELSAKSQREHIKQIGHALCSDPDEVLQWRSATCWLLIARISGTCLILLTFPPFLALLIVGVGVWEETVAYGYLFAVLLLMLLLRFVRHPTVGCWLFLCLLAGASGFVRPTLLIYGFVTVVTGGVFLFMVPMRLGNLQDGLEPRRRQKTLSLLMAGGLLFCTGGALLGWTNFIRFGNGFEFGHKLNIQAPSGLMYATRFDHPFRNQPIKVALIELCGALFCAGEQYGGDQYRNNIFYGQAMAPRWRHFYFRTYDWTYAALLLSSWSVTVFTCIRNRRRKSEIKTRRSLDDSSSRHPDYALNKEVANSYIPDLSYNLIPMVVFSVWSVLAVLLLAVFYLYVPVISSRYMIDFAPAFAAAVSALWIYIASHCSSVLHNMIAYALLIVWMTVQWSFNGIESTGQISISLKHLNSLQQNHPLALSSLMNKSSQIVSDGRSRSLFDPIAWNAQQQRDAVAPILVFFVDDAQFLELILEVQPHPRIAPNPDDIQAKIGLEYLKLEEIVRVDQAWRVRFYGPQQKRYQSGIQVAFIATVPNQFLAEPKTPWILKSVRWKDDIKADDEGLLPEQAFAKKNRTGIAVFVIPLQK